MNQITLLRSKGLTDDEIMEVIRKQHCDAAARAFQIGLREGVKESVDSYAKGFREGQQMVMSLIENFAALARFATQSDAELAS